MITSPKVDIFQKPLKGIRGLGSQLEALWLGCPPHNGSRPNSHNGSRPNSHYLRGPSLSQRTIKLKVQKRTELQTFFKPFYQKCICIPASFLFLSLIWILNIPLLENSQNYDGFPQPPLSSRSGLPGYLFPHLSLPSLLQ